MIQRHNSQPDPRIFLAVDIPNHARLQLLSLTTVQIPNAIIMTSESYHITLHFLGSTPIAPVARVARTIRAAPFDVTLRSVGGFPNYGLPLTVFARLHSHGLMGLQNRLGSALRDAGYDLDRRRRFIPHVSLAKVKRDDDNAVQAAKIFLQENDDFCVDPFPVNEFVLMESVFDSRSEPHYIIRDRFPLVADENNFTTTL